MVEAKIAQGGSARGAAIFVIMGFATKKEKKRWLHVSYCGTDNAKGDERLWRLLERVGSERCVLHLCWEDAAECDKKLAYESLGLGGGDHPNA